MPLVLPPPSSSRSPLFHTKKQSWLQQMSDTTLVLVPHARAFLTAATPRPLPPANHTTFSVPLPLPHSPPPLLLPAALSPPPPPPSQQKQSWLQNMADTTLVLVSHDRSFLTAATQETIQLKDKALRYFPGPYDAFVEARAAAAASAARQVGFGWWWVQGGGGGRRTEGGREAGGTQRRARAAAALLAQQPVVVVVVGGGGWGV